MGEGEPCLRFSLSPTGPSLIFRAGRLCHGLGLILRRRLVIFAILLLGVILLFVGDILAILAALVILDGRFRTRGRLDFRDLV